MARIHGSHVDEEVGAVLTHCRSALLFVGLGVEWIAIGALRRSTALRRAERWARRSLRCQLAAAAVILASGAAMAARLDLFHFAWVNVSLVALVLIAALAGIVTRSRPRAADLPIGRLWPASVAIRIVLALGVFYLMVA